MSVQLSTIARETWAFEEAERRGELGQGPQTKNAVGCRLCYLSYELRVTRTLETSPCISQPLSSPALKFAPAPHS